MGMKNSGQFKKGQHWRPKKPYWDRDWLYREYVTEQKSAGQIAKEQGCKENNILYFLGKHQIPTRTMKEIRAVKYWGLSGEANGMYGRTGVQSVNWKGGCTKDRQAFYSSKEWAQTSAFVWERDKSTCQNCGVHRDDFDKLFHTHHIVAFGDSIELRAEPSNVVLLCCTCHYWVHSKNNTEQKFIEKGGDTNGGTD